jgi:streptomycin 6-kinase
MQLPDELIRNVTHVLGERGRAWLDELPSLLDAAARRYALKIGPPFELSYNYVAPVTLADGTEAVLKLSPHGHEFGYEVRATELFHGHGMARLLDADANAGIALLERVQPGTMLAELADEERQTQIAADVMAELRRDAPADHRLPTTREWFAAFAKHRAEYGGAGPLPRATFERGESTYAELLRSFDGPPALLHGDLHHYNILSAERAPWLAIDPHGVVGDPVFEVGAFFGNPSGLAEQPGLKEILARRADVLSERLTFDRPRVIAWGIAYQTLSAVWSAENGGTGFGRAVRVAEALASIDG